MRLERAALKLNLTRHFIGDRFEKPKHPNRSVVVESKTGPLKGQTIGQSMTATRKKREIEIVVEDIVLWNDRTAGHKESRDLRCQQNYDIKFV